MSIGLDDRPTESALERVKLESESPVRLDIGGAGEPYDRDRYTVVDLYGEPDVRGDIRDLPFENDSVDAIWCSHVLEHLAMTDIPVALRECLRVMKPGHRAIFRVPNFDYVAKNWLTSGDRDWAEKLVFGLQTGEGEFHKSAHTASSIKGDLEGTGWECLRVEMRWTHSQETLQAVARKPDVVV